MIVCGWCGKPTDADRCPWCRHRDPARPWVQRGEEPPVVTVDGGRPALDRDDVAHRLTEARTRLVGEGRNPTAEALAEALDVSPRTVRRWQQVAGMRPVSAHPAD